MCVSSARPNYDKQQQQCSSSSGGGGSVFIRVCVGCFLCCVCAFVCLRIMWCCVCVFCVFFCAFLFCSDGLIDLDGLHLH